MKDFTFVNRTKIVFGRGAEEQAGKEAKAVTEKVLFHYGGGHIKKSGLYQRLQESLRRAGVEVLELGGVQPNPRLSLIRQGIAICRREKPGLILAVGGGSVIDSAKAIAVGAETERELWDFFRREAEVTAALPVGVVLTIPAAGSESSNGAVVTNDETGEKLDIGSPFIRPRFALLNPELTYTLPDFQTACGAADMLAHVMERYFSAEPDTGLSDGLCEAVMRSIIQTAPHVRQAPQEYAGRAELMWAGTLAHNGLLGQGRREEWTSHIIEHELSGLYDVAHGAGLAVVFPAWMSYICTEALPRFIRFATEVWGLPYNPDEPERLAREGIGKLKDFFRSLGLPVTLGELGITEKRYGEMADGALRFGPIGNLKRLHRGDIQQIFTLME